MDYKFEIPVNKIELLSGGKLYRNIPSIIEVENMVTSDEDLLFSASKLAEDGDVFRKLVQQKIKTENVNVDDLLIGDFNQLLIHLRCSGYGSDYTVSTFDSDLEDYIDKPIDLSQLKTKPLGEGYNENGEFTIFLEKMNAEVKFILPTVGMGRTINAMAERRKDPKTGVVPHITTKFEFLITEVNGERNREYIQGFVKIMSPIDALALRKKMHEVEPDILLKWTFETEKTKREYETDFMLGLDFLYPN